MFIPFAPLFVTENVQACPALVATNLGSNRSDDAGKLSVCYCICAGFDLLYTSIHLAFMILHFKSNFEIEKCCILQQYWFEVMVPMCPCSQGCWYRIFFWQGCVSAWCNCWCLNGMKYNIWKIREWDHVSDCSKMRSILHWREAVGKNDLNE